MSTHRVNEEAFSKALEESDKLGEVMESTGAIMPPMGKIAEDMDQMRPSSERKWSDDDPDDFMEGNVMNDDELQDLLEEKTPVLPSHLTFGHSTHEKPKVTLPAEKDDDEEHDDYPESFASQKETSQLREELEALSEEMRDLKATLKGVLKEREALPSHLNVIQEDINRQMTLMLSKLHNLSEADISPATINAVSTSLEGVKEASNERLEAAVSYATDKPRETSPLATVGVDLKGKRRFRPVK
jgi:uncharacterized protein YoxC